MLVTTLFVIAGLLLVTAIISITDSFLQIEAKKTGIDTAKENFSLFPRLGEMFGPSVPENLDRSKYHVLKKGHDIKLTGGASGDIVPMQASRYSVKPTNFRGIAPIPKMLVAEGDEVLAGEALFFDKQNPDIKFVAPVSGEVVEIGRGAKRAIENVVILADKEINYKKHSTPNLSEASRDDIKAFMMESGIWTSILRRPFDSLARPDETPRDIFISTFNSAPLALDQNQVIAGSETHFQKGIDVLAKMTDGKVYLGVDSGNANVSDAFTAAQNAEVHYFAGKHPAGNVGVQIHHIKPIKSGDVVWTLKVQDVISLGKLFSEGIYDASKVVALTGSELSNPKIVRVTSGASVADLLKDETITNDMRIIGGSVLGGNVLSPDSFLDAGSDQLTVIKEGNHHEMFGWLLPLKPRPSVSKTFPNFLFPEHKFEVDTNTHGEKRAFVMTGQYESMLPMDIYPQHLMKAIMAGDFERMEGLGINELSEEDLALCEFACTSKMPLQQILRDGLDMMQEQS